MLNLELIEQKCLRYLTEVSNPLVPISTLMNHINEDEECHGISEIELIDFLRNHELFRVMDPALKEDGEATALPSGIDAGLRVILVTRIPTPSEMASMISTQVNKMAEALSRAQNEAVNAGSAERLAQITSVIKRAETLARQLEENM